MSPRAAWRLEGLGFQRVYDYAAGKLDWLAAGLPAEGRRPERSRIGALVVRDVPTCGLDEEAEAIRARLRGTGWDSCLVVNAERVVLGRVRADDLDGTPADATAEALMREGPSTFRPNVLVGEMLRYMERHRMTAAVVTTSDGRLLGVLRRDDAERAAAETGASAHAPPEQEPYFAR